MQLRVLSTISKESAMTVRDEVFGVKPNQILIAQAVRVYLSNQRQGTSKTLTRSEVARTKKKWFKQKGTGNARHGARTPSLFVGGGVAHGPTGEQNWIKKLSAQMRRSALISALSAQVENIIVSEDIAQLDGKTASAQKILTKMLPTAKHILVILDTTIPLVSRSLQNLEMVYVTSADRLTTYEIAYADGIIFTKKAIEKLEERLMKSRDESEKDASQVIEEKVATPVKKTVVKKVAPEKTEKVVKVKKEVSEEKKTESTEKKSTTKKVVKAKK